MRTTDLPLIRRSRLFAQVGEIDLAAMLTTCFVQTLPAGAVLCHQGEKAEFLHIVLSGRVGLFGSAGHEEALVEFFGAGNVCTKQAANIAARSGSPTWANKRDRRISGMSVVRIIGLYLLALGSDAPFIDKAR